MKKILFLDFDGVLHPDGPAVFSKLTLFERYLEQLHDVEVVISSSWREDYHIDKLREIFDSSLRNKIVAVTPLLPGRYDPGGRQREIEEFLTTHGLDENNASWVALDDIDEFFDPNCPYLILTDSATGFVDRDGELLLQWHRGTHSSSVLK